VTLGPLEYLVIGFKGTEFDGSVAHEIGKVVENGTIRIVDLVFIYRDETGNAVIAELDAKDDPRFAGFASLLTGTMGLFTPEDLEVIATSLPEGTGGLVILFEHHWAVDVKEAIAAKGGFLVSRATIAPEILEELADELDEAIAAGAA
jgi:hypothetical protein